MSEQRFENPAALDSALAAAVITQLQAAIDARGHACLVLSGGSTPRGLFETLAESELAWHKVTVILADERWVPPDHQDCNERMVREHLLNGKAGDARLLSLIEGYPDAAANLATVKRRLAEIATFDVVILGMGLDGHTASLFPDAPELAEGLETTEPALMTSPQLAPHARISLSRKRLVDTRYGVIHIVGEEKHSVLKQAMASNDHLAYPILNFTTGDTSFDVFFSPQAIRRHG